MNLSLNVGVLIYLHYVRETWVTKLISVIFSNFIVLSFFNPKDSVSHMHDVAVYVNHRLPFAWDLYLENSMDSYLCLYLA